MSVEIREKISETMKKKEINIKEKNPFWRGGRTEEEKKIAVIARNKTNKAIESKKIKREPCCVCGLKTTEAHHPNYLKPFEVIWLCKKCHFKLHQDGTKDLEFIAKALTAVLQ